MKNLIKKILKESKGDFDWIEETNPNIYSGALFLITKEDSGRGYDISYDILIRLNDFYLDHNNEIRFKTSSFNDLNRGEWILNDASIGISWLENLIETKYWIPISKENADIIFQDKPNY